MDFAIFKCSIWWFLYDEIERRPMLLPWGHGYWYQCICKMSRSVSSEDYDSNTLGYNISSDDKISKITCPNDKQEHVVSINSLPLWYNIIQFLPKVKDSKELTGCLINRLKTAESEHKTENTETLRLEIKSFIKSYSDQYKQSKGWYEVRYICFYQF